MTYAAFSYPKLDTLSSSSAFAIAKPTECSSRSKLPSSIIKDTAVDLATVVR